MAVDLVVGGIYTFLDGAAEILNIWDVFPFGDGVDPNIQKVQCNAVWFKLTVHPYLINTEAAIGIVRLDLFDNLITGFILWPLVIISVLNLT